MPGVYWFTVVAISVVGTLVTDYFTDVRGVSLWVSTGVFSVLLIIVFAVWKNFGYNMVILLAGLQAIPEELYEAARIDGASAWRQFRHVTLPMLAPMLSMVAILTVAGYFQLFAEPYVMTQGGPGARTRVLVMDIYQNAFQDLKLGYASAETVIMMLVIAIFIAVGRLLQKADAND